MPELPEVETVKCDVLPYVKGRTIKKVEVLDKRNLQHISPQRFSSSLKGQKIMDVCRRAKYIIFKFRSGSALVVHLGMTGSLLFRPDRYTKIVFHLSGNKKLYFSDIRIFGKVWFYKKRPGFEGLGPEPLSDGFLEEDFVKRFKQHKGMVKPLLLNQKFLAGLGNIYALEALYLSGIHPKAKANKVDNQRAGALFRNIRKVLLQALGSRGTSISNYKDAQGQAGGFQLKLKVYGRKGKPCYKCKTPIKRMVLGQRGTFYCPKCQKL